MASAEVRTIDQHPRSLADRKAAETLLVRVAERHAQAMGGPPDVLNEGEAGTLLGRPGTELLGAFEAGVLVGLATLRIEGESGNIEVLGSDEPGRGTGGALLDALTQRADSTGLGALRLRFPAGDARAFALAAGRGFAVTDVAARYIRPPLPPPRVDGARGLELAAMEVRDLPGLVELETRFLQLDRSVQLARLSGTIARRRGQIVGYLAQDGERLGPGLALDVSDLGVLLGRALAGTSGAAMVVLSTAVPSALAALGLGFRVFGQELVMHRGLAPPTRPPLAY
jgi:hypothetical protein